MRRYKNETSIAYIHGRIEAQLEAYAFGIGIPASELAARLGTLLLGTESGPVLGTHDRVPKLPSPPAARSKAVAKVALDGRTSGGASKQRAYWASLSPLQRRREVRRRMQKWSPEAKARWAKGRKH